MAKRTSTPTPILTANKILQQFLTFSNPLQRQIGTDVWMLRREAISFTTNDDKQNSIVIWPFPIKEDLQSKAALYPFYLSITVVLDATESIKEVNIKVFKDDTLKPSKADIKPTELLLRAEWADEANGDHAQPHWHIHSYTLIDILSKYSYTTQKSLMELLNEDELLTSLEDLEESMSNNSEIVLEQNQVVPKKKIPMFRFHLSMLSEWDKEISTTQCKKLYDNNLKTWLPQCLNYIKVQLEYLLQKI